jgi:hypothetical protein
MQIWAFWRPVGICRGNLKVSYKSVVLVALPLNPPYFKIIFRKYVYILYFGGYFDAFWGIIWILGKFKSNQIKSNQENFISLRHCYQHILMHIVSYGIFIYEKKYTVFKWIICQNCSRDWYTKIWTLGDFSVWVSNLRGTTNPQDSEEWGSQDQ